MQMVFKCIAFVTLLVHCLYFTKADDSCEMDKSNTVECTGVDLMTVQNFLSNTTGDNVEELDLYYCYIYTFNGETIPESTASSLKTLNIVTESLSLFMSDFLANFTQLETLTISLTYMEEMKPGIFNPAKNLKTIKILTESTDMEVGLFSDLANLEHLYYESKTTKLAAGSFRNLPNLRDLTLIPQGLASMEPGVFVNMPSLEKITIYAAKLIILEAGTFSNLPMLYMVIISGDDISEIKTGTFENSNAIEYVDFKSNKLHDVNNGWFDGMPKLVQVNLSFNLLKDLNVSALAESIPPYTVIDLNDNPWKCSNLPKILDDFSKTKLLSYWGPFYNGPINYNGIPCIIV